MPIDRKFPYQLHWAECPTYTQVTVTGRNSPETYLAYATDLIDHCRANGIRRVLIDDRLAGPRMSVLELFSVIPEASKHAMGVFEAVAFVDEQIGDMAHFAETVAVNRGVNVAIFTSLDEAKRWLARLPAPVQA